MSVSLSSLPSFLLEAIRRAPWLWRSRDSRHPVPSSVALLTVAVSRLWPHSAGPLRRACSVPTWGNSDSRGFRTFAVARKHLVARAAGEAISSPSVDRPSGCAVCALNESYSILLTLSCPGQELRLMNNPPGPSSWPRSFGVLIMLHTERMYDPPNGWGSGC